MFLKAFLVFSCLVLHTAAMPTAKVNEIDTLEQLKETIPKIKCNTSRIQNVNLTLPGSQCPGHQRRQETFCQISKALKGSNCTKPEMRELQRLSHQMQGNATCPLPDNGEGTNRSNMGAFLNDLEQYASSLRTICPRR